MILADENIDHTIIITEKLKNKVNPAQTSYPKYHSPHW